MYTQTQPILSGRDSQHGQKSSSVTPVTGDAKEILWDSVRGKRLSEIVFRRNHTLGGFIADYLSPQYHLVILVNDPGVSSKHWFYARQDAQLRHMGFRVLRFTCEEVHRELPLVLDSIVEVVSQIARRLRKL